jgi:nucleotide-binding universal stress UspA family protein
MKKILVPLDGSALSRRALPYAAALAHATGARLLLARVAHASPFFAEDLAVAQLAAIGEAEADLEAATRLLRAEGLQVEARVPYGPAAPGILDEARFCHVDLVVMSTHGRSGLGRWLYGSVADEVLRATEVPVLVVPPGAPGGWSRDGDAHVLVPLDGSELAEEALRPAADLAAALGATLVLLRVVEPFYYGYMYGEPYPPAPEVQAEAALAVARGYLDGLATRLGDGEVAVEIRVEVGPPAATIASVAHELGASAIALATHGRSGLARVVLGSVATGLLHRADAPILLVHPAAVGRADQPASAAPTATTPVGPASEPESLLLTARERELVERGLESLLGSGDQDPRLAEPVRALLDRIKAGTATTTGARE